MRKNQEINQAIAILQQKGNKVSLIQTEVLEGRHTEVWAFEHYVRDVSNERRDEIAYCAARDAALFLSGKIELEEFIPDFREYKVPEEAEASKLPSGKKMWETIQALTKRIELLEKRTQKPKTIVKDTDMCIQKEYSPLDESDYLLQSEAYKYIGCSLTTLKAWKKKGIIPVYRNKGRIYFKISEIDKNKAIQVYKKRYK